MRTRAKLTADSPLTPRQLRFCEEYLRCGVARAAYVKAGYSAKTADTHSSQLLKQAHVAAYVARGRERMASEADIDRVWVLKRLKGIVDNPYAKDRDVIAALTQVGRVLGIFADKLEVVVNLTPEQRRERIVQLLTKGLERAAQGGQGDAAS